MQISVRQTVPMQSARQLPERAGQAAAEAGRIGWQGPLFRAQEPFAHNLVKRSGVRDLPREEKAFADDETTARRAHRGRDGCFDPRLRDVRGGRGFALGRAAQAARCGPAHASRQS